MAKLCSFLSFLLVVMIGQTLAHRSIASDHQMSSDTRKELAQARRVTAKYHNIDTAFAEGFFDADFVLPGVGCHLINPGLVDGEFSVTEPEILIYADCTPGLGGKAELRALEYVTLCGGPPSCTLPAPEGFTGDYDVWVPFVDGSLWTLHVWTWRHNPDGIFVKVNPRIPQ